MYRIYLLYAKEVKKASIEHLRYLTITVMLLISKE